MTDPQSLIDTANDICKAATPGPWYGDQSTMSVSGICSHIEMNDDVIFIETARELVPALAEALGTATRERDEARTELAKLKSDTMRQP